VNIWKIKSLILSGYLIEYFHYIFKIVFLTLVSPNQSLPSASYSKTSDQIPAEYIVHVNEVSNLCPVKDLNLILWNKREECNHSIFLRGLGNWDAE